MGDNRIRKVKSDAELDRLDPAVTRDLLAFNLTKQRIVDLCNEELALDPLEGEISYSSFHRALDGFDAYVGIVRALNDLRYEQQTNPKKFLPIEGPGENLAEWMGQFAKATWWFDLLDLDITQSTLNAWFSGRGKRERSDIREQVVAWWERLQAAANEAERATAAIGRDRCNGDRPDANSWDTWCKDLIEDGVSLGEVKQRFIAEGMIADSNYFGMDMIELADPQNPVSEIQGSKHSRDRRENEWRAMVERDFALAVSRIPPDFNPTPYHEENRWGDRRNENGPADLNTPLYRLHYRTRYRRFWNSETRCVDVESQIVGVSPDGRDWREPTKRESLGWDRGFNEWLVAMDAGKDTDNLYTQELNAAETRVRRLEQSLSICWNASEEIALQSKLKEAREDANFAYRNTG